LGIREPEIYGGKTLHTINQALQAIASAQQTELRIIQSNHEGVLIDALHEGITWADGILINPGAYTHTSLALRDAIVAVRIPTVEVHLSNIYAREVFRQKSLTAPACIGQVSGFGWRSYLLGLTALIEYLSDIDMQEGK
jgi:3-dehydroquinate dehydratase-2